jgi:hypothetical protein
MDQRIYASKLILAVLALLSLFVTKQAFSAYIKGQVPGGGVAVIQSIGTPWQASAGVPKQIAKTQTDKDGRFVIHGSSAPAAGLDVINPMIWRSDWAWGLPLIVLTVVIHVLGLGLIGQALLGGSDAKFQRRYPIAVFATVVGATTLLATCLHAIEAAIWASAYLLLGALPDQRSAMLYSLNAITSYGHATLSLKDQWELLGALEALNGWLLFGLSTAFLMGVITKVWALEHPGVAERIRYLTGKS